MLNGRRCSATLFGRAALRKQLNFLVGADFLRRAFTSRLGARGMGRSSCRGERPAASFVLSRLQ